MVESLCEYLAMLHGTFAITSAFAEKTLILTDKVVVLILLALTQCFLRLRKTVCFLLYTGFLLFIASLSTMLCGIEKDFMSTLKRIPCSLPCIGTSSFSKCRNPSIWRENQREVLIGFSYIEIRSLKKI